MILFDEDHWKAIGIFSERLMALADSVEAELWNALDLPHDERYDLWVYVHPESFNSCICRRAQLPTTLPNRRLMHFMSDDYSSRSENILDYRKLLSFAMSCIPRRES